MGVHAGEIAVLLDDELQNMLWMVDYLESLGLDVQLAREAGEAVAIIDQDKYRLLIIDLNIPVFEPFEAAVSELGGLYIRYPGLFVAKHARTKGYRDRQVVLYTAHRDPEVSIEANRLGCTYIIKGRPQEIKAEIEAVLGFDPTRRGD